MKTVEECRRLHLLELRKKRSLAEINELLGLERRDSTLSQICNQAEGTKTKKPKTMGSPLARKIEEKLGLPTGLMDSDPDSWPFPHIERERFESLKEHQKIEIQGHVRVRILEFENANQPNVRVFEPLKPVAPADAAPPARKGHK